MFYQKQVGKIWLKVIEIFTKMAVVVVVVVY